MNQKQYSVYALFSSESMASQAVDALRVAGFRNADVSVLFPDVSTTKEFAHEKATKAPEGAAVGATTGAVVGGVLGWLAGIGSIAIPGVGPFIAAGPIMAALAGTGVGGATGGLTGALIGLGMPEFEAKRYQGQVAKGGILMSVHCDDKKWSDRAEEILTQCGATEITSAGEASADYPSPERPEVIPPSARQ